MDRKRIEQFVRKDAADRDASGKLQRGATLPCFGKGREMPGQLIATRGGTFDSNIVQSAEEFRQAGLREFENVAGEAAGARSGFHQQEFLGTIENLPHFRELAREKTPEDWADIHAGEVIMIAASFGLRIVAIERVIEALAHVLGESDGTVAPDAFGEQSSERGHAEAAPEGASFRSFSQAD